MPSKKRKNKHLNGTRTSRLNLRIHPDLQEWIHGYAKIVGKSVSAIVMEHFLVLRERERGADVEQI